MITRIRIVSIKPGTIEKYRLAAIEWTRLLHKHGGKVLGFYHDKENNKVIGIAEYKSREELDEIQKKCEKEEEFPKITSAGKEIITGFEEMILDKLEIQL
jgi:hypothetical protein